MRKLSETKKRPEDSYKEEKENKKECFYYYPVLVASLTIGF
ncbi:hypothetical protein [Methanosarcina horonobensis]|nr:hypothetical protein [Methanosarcina horonobensis]